MESVWYYARNDERLGPVDKKELILLIEKGAVDSKTLVWTKGLKNWVSVGDVDELKKYFIKDKKTEKTFDWSGVEKSEKIFIIRQSPESNIYGPFSLESLLNFYRERRVNAQTLIFSPGMTNWEYIADIPIYESIFSELPPKLSDIDRRKNIRKPFVARLFFHDNKSLFEGACRDISLGGMQVLVSNFPGKKGDVVSINVHPDNSQYHFITTGKIGRLLDQSSGVFIRFESLSEEAEKAIKSYING